MLNLTNKEKELLTKMSNYLNNFKDKFNKGDYKLQKKTVKNPNPPEVWQISDHEPAILGDTVIWNTMQQCGSFDDGSYNNAFGTIESREHYLGRAIVKATIIVNMINSHNEVNKFLLQEIDTQFSKEEKEIFEMVLKLHQQDHWKIASEGEFFTIYNSNEFTLTKSEPLKNTKNNAYGYRTVFTRGTSSPEVENVVNIHRPQNTTIDLAQSEFNDNSANINLIAGDFNAKISGDKGPSVEKIKNKDGFTRKHATEPGNYVWQSPDKLNESNARFSDGFAYRGNSAKSKYNDKKVVLDCYETDRVNAQIGVAKNSIEQNLKPSADLNDKDKKTTSVASPLPEQSIEKKVNKGLATPNLAEFSKWDTVDQKTLVLQKVWERSEFKHLKNWFDGLTVDGKKANSFTIPIENNTSSKNIGYCGDRTNIKFSELSPEELKTAIQLSLFLFLSKKEQAGLTSPLQLNIIENNPKQLNKVQEVLKKLLTEPQFQNAFVLPKEATSTLATQEEEQEEESLTRKKTTSSGAPSSKI